MARRSTGATICTSTVVACIEPQRWANAMHSNELRFTRMLGHYHECSKAKLPSSVKCNLRFCTMLVDAVLRYELRYQLFLRSCTCSLLTTRTDCCCKRSLASGSISNRLMSALHLDFDNALLQGSQTIPHPWRLLLLGSFDNLRCSRCKQQRFRRRCCQLWSAKS